jgi:hypothetical protein
VLSGFGGAPVFGVLEWRNCSDSVLERPKKSGRMLALVGVAKSHVTRSWPILRSGWSGSMKYQEAEQALGTYCMTVSIISYKRITLIRTHQNRPPARARRATPPITIPTIAPVPRPDDFVLPLVSEDSSEVESAPAADVVLEVGVASELVTVTVAVWARLSIEVFTSAGSVWPGVNTYAASCAGVSIISS